MKCDLDPFELEMKEALSRIHADDGDAKSAVAWTSAIKDEIGGLRKDLRAYSSRHGDHREWLYDLTLLAQYEGGALHHCVLALESEWGSASAVSDDFQKLMLCRADYRAMIFEARRGQDPQKRVEELIQEVEDCASSVKGDRYFFAVWVRGEGFRFFTHRASGHLRRSRALKA